MKRLFCYLSVLFLAFTWGFAKGAPSDISLEYKVSYLFHTSQNGAPEEILAMPFHPLEHGAFSFGRKSSDLWLKIVCTNTTEQTQYILTTNESFYEVADLYTQEAEGQWHVEKNGLFLPIDQRHVKSKLLSFPVEIRHGETKTYYLRLNGKLNYLGEIKVFSADTFNLYEIVSLDFFTLSVVGIFFIISLFNLFLFYSNREKIYLYYLVYTLSGFVYFTISSGIMFYLHLQDYFYVLFAAAPVSMAFFLYFTQEILETKTHYPRFHKITKVFAMIFIALAVILPIQFTPWNIILNLIVMVTIIIVMIFVLFFHTKSFKGMRLYTAGVTLYFTSLMVAVLFGLGVFEYSFFTRHAIFLGALVETLVFQALIVTRYETSRKNELALKNDMIALQLEANKALESKVEERTKKLSAMLVERELLLKEVHHRVKNNFHSLIALLWMDDEKNGSHRNTEMINHLKALSDVHEQLCAMEDLQRIDLKKYIHKIIDNLQIAFDDPINFNQNIVSTSVVLDIAMAIGVIVNEIVTNAVKHSESTKKLIVTLSLKESDGFIYLEIDDNNPGTIQEESKGFGIGLVQQFASLLPNATFAFKEHGFKLTFSKEQH